MSHEIRTPMNAVLGFTELLHSLITDPKQLSYLEAIRSSGKSLLTLINDILDLSKIEARRMELHYEPVFLESIFKEIQNIFSLKIAEKGLGFTVEIDPSIPHTLLLDEVRLRQIIFNLIGNAVKFTDTGYIKLTAYLKEFHENTHTYDLIISVEDTGIGIPEEAFDKIFQAFKQQDSQTTKHYGGTGLGLTITKRLVEMMGGSISVRSEVGKGSTFDIFLPNIFPAEAPQTSYAEEVTKEEHLIFDPALVLVVDDIDTNRNLVKEYFQDTNVSIIEAENGEKAIILAKHYLPDVILMDLRMPVMDGYEAASNIRKDSDTATIPIIALTASGMKDEQEKTRRKGFDGYLVKPVRKMDLFKELARFLPHKTANMISHQESEKSSKLSITSDTNLPPVASENLSIIIEKLDNELKHEWQSVQKTGFFNEIKEFAEKILTVGQTYSFDMLTNYGQNLINQVNSFDIEQMNAILNSYPDLVQRVKDFHQ